MKTGAFGVEKAPLVVFDGDRDEGREICDGCRGLDEATKCLMQSSFLIEAMGYSSEGKTIPGRVVVHLAELKLQCAQGVLLALGQEAADFCGVKKVSDVRGIQLAKRVE